MCRDGWGKQFEPGSGQLWLWTPNNVHSTLGMQPYCDGQKVCVSNYLWIEARWKRSVFKAEFFILFHINMEQTFQWPTSLRKLMWNIEGWVYLASFVSKVLAARTSHIWVAKFKLQYFVTSIFKHFRSRNCYLNVHNRVVLHVKNITCLQLSQPIQSMKV